MSTLEQILGDTRKRVEALRQHRPLEELRRQVEASAPLARGFRTALVESSTCGVAVIAELKKASPSKGVLRGTFPVARLAAQLQEGGAAALSVLTEEKYFQGSLENLREASAATRLPCLRKDFIVDEYQLFEARLNDADAVLLIAAALGDPEFGMLYRRARELGMDVLCEVHNEVELARAVASGVDIIGVNSRDLKTLQVDMQTQIRLAPHLPKNAVRVAESGIRTAEDIRQLRSAGYQAFLIGETLMQANVDDSGMALAQLIGSAKAPPLGSSGVAGWATGTKD